MIIRLVLAAVLALAAFAARFDINTPGRIVRLSDPQISPDGKSIAVIVSRSNFEENRTDANLVLIDVASRQQRTLTRDRRGVAQPRWSPTGNRLGFLATVDGKTQIHILPFDGGDAFALTRTPQGVQQFSWSPDGKRIAFVTFDDPPKVEGVERHNKSFEAAHNDFLTTTHPRPSHLWIIASDGGNASRITSGNWTLPISFPPSPPAAPLSWTPDGKSVTIVKVATPYSGDFNQSTVQVLDVASGAMRQLTSHKTDEGQPLISPDGQYVAYWYPRDGQSKNVNEVMVAPFAGGEGRSVTRPLDRNVQRAIWMADSRSLLVSANDGTGVAMWIQPVDGPAKRIQTGKVVPTTGFWLDASVNPQGRIAFVGSEPMWPAELYFVESAAAGPVRLTEFNKEIAAMELGRPESIQWKGPDGLQMDGVVTYPPGFQAGRKYPLVLYVHGGPRSASKEAFSNYAQLFSAQGWVVFEPNYRGSDNLGNAFQSAIWNNAGDGPGRDVMSGVDLLKRRGFVDDTRIAVSGWSYGGYMTSWLIGHYPDVWRAAVAGAAVTDWMDQYNLGDANVRRGTAFGGSPYTDAARMAEYRKQSPMAEASRIKTPTLILATTGDYRVPISQSYRLYNALRDNGVPVRFFAYPVAGHSPTDPVHTRDVMRRWVDWLQTYLKL
ncbi:MAG: S9 family peptidase [Candidatus Solibacter usitatus]|nr:S9 family peptidase [Candidatus Solibacter usitatus]